MAKNDTGNVLSFVEATSAAAIPVTAGWLIVQDDGTVFYDNSKGKRIQLTDKRYLPLTGGTLTGALNMGSKKITSLATPTAATDAANKSYVDTKSKASGELVILTGDDVDKTDRTFPGAYYVSLYKLRTKVLSTIVISSATGECAETYTDRNVYVDGILFEAFGNGKQTLITDNGGIYARNKHYGANSNGWKRWYHVGGNLLDDYDGGYEQVTISTASGITMTESCIISIPEYPVEYIIKDNVFLQINTNTTYRYCDSFILNIQGNNVKIETNMVAVANGVIPKLEKGERYLVELLDGNNAIRVTHLDAIAVTAQTVIYDGTTE